MWNSFFAICLYCEIASRSLVWLSKMARCICRIWRSADLRIARKSVIIESPFLRTARAERFIPIFHRLKKRGVATLLNTKPLEEHDEIYKLQAQKSLILLQFAGVDVLFTVKHHRKLAIIDKEIIYEGSLNIFSYRDSCEIMRRTTSVLEAEMLMDFIGLNKFMEVR